MEEVQCYFDDNMLDGEKSLIIKVLQHYKIQAESVYKKRSAYRINTSEKAYCLKRMSNTKAQIKNGYIVTEELRRIGFLNVVEYIPTKDKKLYIIIGNYLFYMTTWFEGREADLCDLTEAKEAVRLLAEFHLSVQKINTSSLKIRNNSLNWLKIYDKKLRDFKKYTQIINGKLLLSQFDREFYSDIINQYNYGKYSLDLIKANYYNEINPLKVGICHDSFYYQNLIKYKDTLNIIDLDSMVIDIQITDLAKFIRRLMYRSYYSWDFDKAKSLIETYSSIRSISLEELYLILAVISFPHRFWKLGRKRYIKFNSWPESKFIKKLRKLSKFRKSYEKFIMDFEKYIKEQ